jgi:hypothetical protein
VQDAEGASGVVRVQLVPVVATQLALMAVLVPPRLYGQVMRVVAARLVLAWQAPLLLQQRK